MPKNLIKRVCCILIASVAVLCCGCSEFGYCGNVTETYDLADYGVIYGAPFEYKGSIERAFHSLFPPEIPPSFEDVQYHYAVTDVGEGYEINLEFTIPDKNAFYAYIESVAPLEEFQPFPYDEYYLEYLPCKNYLSILAEDEFSEEDALTFNWVDHAVIKRVLINLEERRAIIVIMRAGPITFCSNQLRLDYFLRRFHIDPRQFAEDYGDGWERTS